ncbi:MAG: ThiF family adenylyltransferase [Candidatus Brocadiae bacterium]|nr:ThiF family adenylyltransferase [Candidatus Brocadiia bacterium]
MNIPQILYLKSAWDEMQRIVGESGNVETGGLLLGKVCRSETGRSFIITQVTGPGPNAVLSENSFLPDMEYYRKARVEHPHLVYLGEWHKHPGCHKGYSHQDFYQVQKILDQENRQEFLCCICSIGQEKTIEMQCFYLNQELNQFLSLSYSMLMELQDQRIRSIFVEDKVLEKFLASQKPYSKVQADVREGIAHLFYHPYSSNQSVLLANVSLCPEISLDGERSLVLLVNKKKGSPVEIRCYHCLEDQTCEIESQILSLRKDIFRRNRSLMETTRLRGKHIVFLGLGSIGSNAALELTRAGVDRFTLIDPDTVQIENICRHACDLTELGMKKVDAVAQRIRRIMPYSQIHCHAIDANENPDKTLAMCQDADLIFVSTDTENSRRLANWIGHEAKIPIIYAGLLERAAGGRVWRIIPGKTACYDCYPSHKNTETKGPIAYSEISSLDDLSIQPGLGNDIAFVTHLAVRFALDTIKGRQDLSYHIVFWFNRRYRGMKNIHPLTLYRVEELPQHTDCPVCISQERRKA